MSKEATVDPMDLPWWRITGAYVGKLLGSLLAYFILRHFWGKYMLTSFSQLEGRGFVGTGLERVWFIFAWAVVITLLSVLVFNQRHTSMASRGTQVIKGLWLSANAGVFEELIFRALMFLNAMVTLVFFNFITFGLVRWLFTHWFTPLANWATFHALQPELMDHHNWLFGAAIVSAASAFRDAHKCLGLFGWVNAWFGGMVLFWLVFNYGLLTAIVAHAMYDALIFTIRGFTSEEGYVTYRRRARVRA